MVKDFSAWANAWSDYSRSDVNYLVFVVGGTAALVVLALSLLLESNCTVLTFFCGLAVVVTLAGIWVVNFYPIWMEDSPEPAVFTTQVEKEFGVRNLSCSPAVMSTKDALPDAAVSLYRDYGSQENFVSKYISNDLRSVTREIAGKYDTITMLTDRGSFTRGVQKALSEKWKGMGLTVEQVSVQDVRYPKEITSAYAAAQAAEVQKRKASNEQETAKVEAETKRIKAQGEADANDILNSSLSENVLRQKYIDALSNAKNLTVVPDGSVPMVQTK